MGCDCNTCHCAGGLDGVGLANADLWGAFDGMVATGAASVLVGPVGPAAALGISAIIGIGASIKRATGN